MMAKLVVKGCERITHLDVMTDMKGDGYQIHRAHEWDIRRFSSSSGPYVHHYSNL